MLKMSLLKPIRAPRAPHPTQAPALELRCIRFSSVRGFVSTCRGLLATEPQKAYCQAVRNLSEACFVYFWGHGLKMLKMNHLKTGYRTFGPPSHRIQDFGLLSHRVQDFWSFKPKATGLLVL